jgi:hypothetical protein
MIRPLYLQEKSLQYTSDRRMGGPQSRSGSGGEEKKIHALLQSGIEPRLSSM